MVKSANPIKLGRINVHAINVFLFFRLLIVDPLCRKIKI